MSDDRQTPASPALKGSIAGDRRVRLAALVIILLIASAFRFNGLDNFPTPRGASPPGLEHDEIAHWLVNRDILAGRHAVYFTEAYGHEALYHYLQAGFGALVGDHALGLRLPSAFLGVLLVAVSYALGRRMFGPWAGLWSAAFLAVLFWPVFYSRLALRAISLPVFSGLAAWFWWRGYEDRPGSGSAGEPRGNNRVRARDQFTQHPASSQSLFHSPTFLMAIAGLFAGLSLHTYMAARAVPIFFALYTTYLLLFDRVYVRRNWRGIVVFWLVMIVVAAPLAWFLLSNPGAEVRVAEVNAPLRALLAGDIGPVLENALKIAGMFGFRGDPLWRQNVAGRPVFDPVMATLFYVGIAHSLWRWRERRHVFLLLWLTSAMIPSLVTIDAPSSIRSINLLPIMMLFPLALIPMPPNLSTVRDKLSTGFATKIVHLTLLVLWVYAGWSTVVGLWRTWPANDEVRFVWQAALTEAGTYLDHSTSSGPAAIGGWTSETMDPPTMALTLRRDDLSLRYFDPTQSLILPVSPDSQAIRIVKPAILPFAPSLRSLIAPWEQAQGDFTLYELPAPFEVRPRYPADADFAGQLKLIGYDVAEGCAPTGPCRLLTYWLVTAPADGPRRMFLHAVDGAGAIVAQDDRLGAPADDWQAGDVIVQLMELPETTGELRLGVYDPASERRLTIAGDGDFLPISIR